jgi:polyphosphate glucokinase
MRVLVIDLGGTHAKLLVTGQNEPRSFDSGPDLRPDEFVARIHDATTDWQYDAISFGYPGAVDANGPSADPGNLGKGWVGFDFEAALKHPIRFVNDAAMQALGAYEGGRMLFLGLGTGIGSTLVANQVVVPLELGCLPGSIATGGGSPTSTLFERLGREALERDGEEAWVRGVHRTVEVLREAMAANYVTLGGGNAKLIDPLPPRTRRGGNEDAFTGGFRLWEEPVTVHDNHRQPGIWRVVC